MNSSSTTTAITNPLASVHAAEHAQMGVWFGSLLPDNFGDWRSEYSFSRDTVALIDKNYRSYFSFTGPDRVRYLNAILTNNIKDLSAGRGIVSLLLSPQGRILAEIETFARTDELFCVSFAMIRERLLETLNKFIIMDDVTLADHTDRFGTLALEGPAAAAVVHELTGVDLGSLPELGETEISHLQVGGVNSGISSAIPCRIIKRSPGATPSAEFLLERENLCAAWDMLAAAARKHRGGPMGYTALNALRLEQGIPWFNYDFGEKQIPHEAALEESHISYTKGCYTGQEIVERVRSRGQVNRRRTHFIFTGSDVPAAGEPLTADGKDAGFVTRAAFSPALSKPIGMGYVRRENSAPGAALQWRGGTAEVSEFPAAIAKNGIAR